MRSPERAALVLAVLCMALLALVDGRPYFTTNSFPQRGIMDPQIAMQMARNVPEIDAVLGEAPSPDRLVMRMKQYIDFAYIASYTALLLVIGWGLSRVSRWAWAIGIFGVLAGIHDVLENVDILRIVNLPLSAVTPAMISHLHLMSVVKWGFASITMAILAVFTLRSRRWFLRLIGGIDVLAFGMILWGLVENPWLVWAGFALAAGMIANAATLKFLIADTARRA